MAGARVSGFTVLVASLTILGILILAPTLKIVVEQRQQVADLQADLKRNQNALNSLNKQKARWDDPAYIRTQARDRLYYVMPGEINFLVVNDVNIEPSRVEAPSASLTTTDTNWVAGALNSVLYAGLSDKPASGAK